MNRSETKKLLVLIEEWTRAETIARHGEWCLAKDWGDFFQVKLNKEDEIRELVFGTSDLVVLGVRWNILKHKKKLKAKVRHSTVTCQGKLKFNDLKKGDRTMVKARVKKMKAKQRKKAGKKAHKKAGGTRPVGRTSGVGVMATWVLAFEHNNKVASAKRRTDKQITVYMNKEFPARKSEIFNHVQLVRNRYNKGALSGKVPKRLSKRHGDK